MKIALFSETYVPAVNGVATHVNLLKKGLEKLGHEVLVVCGVDNVRKHVLKNGVLYCPAVDLKKLYQTAFVAGPISHSRFKYVKNFAPDVIHVHTEFGIGYSGMSIAKYLKIPLVYTMHTMYYDYLYYIFNKKFINLAKSALRFYAKVIAQKATCITGPSKKVEKFFHDDCGVKKPVKVIANPVELDLFNFEKFSLNDRLKLKKELGVAANETLVCFCGRLGREKGIDVLLKFWNETVKQSGNYKLLILGVGPCLNDLKACCNKFNLQDQVIFFGKVSNKKLPIYYSACDFYVTTSLSDTNSISMLEAMASGLPVFHLFDKLNSNQIQAGTNGYFFKNPVEMKKLFDDYRNMNDYDKLKLKKKVRNSVMQFGEVPFAEKLVKVYEEALEKNLNRNIIESKFRLNLKKMLKRS